MIIFNTATVLTYKRRMTRSIFINKSLKKIKK